MKKTLVLLTYLAAFLFWYTALSALGSFLFDIEYLIIVRNGYWLFWYTLLLHWPFVIPTVNDVMYLLKVEL